jgi:hypothetical protein
MATLLLLSIAGNIYYWDKSQDLADEKDRVEQKANALLLGQSRNMDDLNKQVDRVQQKNQLLISEVEELNKYLGSVELQLCDSFWFFLVNQKTYHIPIKNNKISSMTNKRFTYKQTIMLYACYCHCYLLTHARK